MVIDVDFEKRRVDEFRQKARSIFEEAMSSTEIDGRKRDFEMNCKLATLTSELGILTWEQQERFVRALREIAHEVMNPPLPPLDPALIA